MEKYRVFMEAKVIVEREFEADSFEEAREKMARAEITGVHIGNGEVADTCITAAENTATGEMHYYEGVC